MRRWIRQVQGWITAMLVVVFAVSFGLIQITDVSAATVIKAVYTISSSGYESVEYEDEAGKIITVSDTVYTCKDYHSYTCYLYLDDGEKVTIFSGKTFDLATYGDVGNTGGTDEAVTVTKFQYTITGSGMSATHEGTTNNNFGEVITRSGNVYTCNNLVNGPAKIGGCSLTLSDERVIVLDPGGTFDIGTQVVTAGSTDTGTGSTVTDPSATNTDSQVAADNCGKGDDLGEGLIGLLTCPLARLVTELVDTMIANMLIPMLQWRIVL